MEKSTDVFVRLRWKFLGVSAKHKKQGALVSKRIVKKKIRYFLLQIPLPYDSVEFLLSKSSKARKKEIRSDLAPI